MDESTFDLLLTPHLLKEVAPKLSRQEILSHLRAFLALLQAEKVKTGSSSGAGGMTPEEPDVSVVPPDNQTPPVSHRLATRKQAVLQLLSLQLCSLLDWNLSSLSSGLPLSLQQQLFDCVTGATSTQKLLSELCPENVQEKVSALSPPAVFALALFFRWVVHGAAALNLPMPSGSKAQIHAAVIAGKTSYTAGPDLPIAASGGSDQSGGPLHQWLIRLVPLALKVLQAILDEELHCALPDIEAVVMEDNVVSLKVEGASEESGKGAGGGTPAKKRKKEATSSGNAVQSQWKALIHFDLAKHSFGTEDYDLARKHVDAIESLRPLPPAPRGEAAEAEAALLKGMTVALSKADEGHTLHHCVLPEEALQTLKMLEKENKSVPFYQRLNLELLARCRVGGGDVLDDGGELAENTLAERIDRGHPPAEGHYGSSSVAVAVPDEGDSSLDARKRRMLAALTETELPSGWTAKINLTPKLSDSKSRDPKVKRRQQMAALLRETRPGKLQKAMQDAQKFPPTFRRMAQDAPDPASQAFVSAFAASNATVRPAAGQQQAPQQQQLQAESETVSAMVHRTGQLLRSGDRGAAQEAAGNLMQAVEEAEKARIARIGGGAGQHFKVLQRKWFAAKMDAKARGNLPLTPEEQKRCQQHLSEMRSVLAHQAAANVSADKLSQPSSSVPGSSAGAEVIESSLAALVNLEDLDFLLKLPIEPKFPLLALSQQTLQLAAAARGDAITLDIRKTCQAVADSLRPLVTQPPFSHSSGSKRSRDSAGGVGKDEGRAALVRFLRRIQHLGFLQVVVSYLATIHNEKAEDPSCRIHHDFPVLPFPGTTTGSNSSVSSSDILTVISQVTSGAGQSSHFDSSWTRLRAEVQFAQGNLSAALVHYLESVVAQTEYFSKAAFQGEMDEKVVTKMVKCLLELQYHTYAVAMSQSQQPQAPPQQQQGTGADGQPTPLQPTPPSGAQADYTVSFKNLEERQSNDAMDGLYRNLWDVTILEYAVSMHTKKGELSRKKAALRQIGALEVNTNNNVEILRETAHYKRCSLLRTLCLHFL